MRHKRKKYEFKHIEPSETGEVPDSFLLATHISNWALFSRDRLCITDARVVDRNGTGSVVIAFTDGSVTNVILRDEEEEKA